MHPALQNANPVLKGGCLGAVFPPKMSFPRASSGSCYCAKPVESRGSTLPGGRYLQAECLMGTSPPQPEASQTADNSESSVGYQGSSGWTAPRGSPTWGPLCLAPGPLGAAGAARDPEGPQAPCLYFLSLVFPCSPLEQSLRAEGNAEENFPEFPNSLPSLPAGTDGISTDPICPRVRVGAGCPWAFGQENRWPCKGTKDYESTLDVQGTSQTRTFKGLPSLRSAHLC